MADKVDLIKRIAKDVYRTLGSGFSEDVYDRAMQVGLQLRELDPVRFSTFACVSLRNQYRADIGSDSCARDVLHKPLPDAAGGRVAGCSNGSFSLREIAP